MKIPFTKMHGLGNDFIVLKDPALKVPHVPATQQGHAPDAPLPEDLSGFCRKYADRRFGIGFDQALILRPSDRADFRMEIYNADGSQVEMCGNGIRCVAKYIWERGLSDRGLSSYAELTIETQAGIIRPRKVEDLVEVDMGIPVIGGPGISQGGKQGSPMLSLEVEHHKYGVTCLSMGNPHAVLFVPDVATFPVEQIGPAIERHPAFPDRTNVEFVQVQGPDAIRMRVWERGAGETLACGTGACAAAVAAHLNGLTGRSVRVQLAGGALFIHWTETDQHVLMTGPAVEVFEGVVEF
jgi:diaminopimelate epimerase